MTGRLRSGMDITLSNNTPSVFGDIYLAKFKIAGINSIPSLQVALTKGESLGLDDSAYRELWLEIFRTEHPELKQLPLKSRLNSFFVTESIDDARRYITRKEFKGQSRIFEVKSQSSGLNLDMTWLDQKFPRDFRQFGYYYLRYWQGLKIDDDPYLKAHETRGSLIEVLLDERIIIGEIVA